MSEQQFLFKIQGPNELASGVYYEVDLGKAPIGVGGMGQVFVGVRVEERSGVKKEVAVKFLQENLPASVVARAEREASIRLKNDNLVEMIDFVRIDQVDPQGKPVTRLHVVSELLRGVMLFDLLQGKTTDAYGEEVPYARELLALYQSDRCKFAITIGKKVLSGLTALHDAGYIHRDIDPSNIMITVDHKVKLIDFGIARPFNTLGDERQLTSAGNFLGKASYAAPELVLGDISHQNETTDIYAVGILLFLLSTGRLPFEGPAQDVMGMQCKSPMPLDMVDDKNLRKIIGTATDKSQQKRYQTASEFRVALDKYWNGSASQQPSISSFDPYSASNVQQGTAISSPSSPGTVITPGATTAGNGTYVPRPIDNRSNQQNIWIWAASALAGLIVGVILHFVI